MDKFSLNTFHSDRWRLRISNIPFMDTNATDLLTKFVANIDLPDINLPNGTIRFGGHTEYEPYSMQDNTGLSPLTVTFKMNEYLQNWYALYRWVANIRRGKFELDAKDLKIAELAVEILDNQSRPTVELQFLDLLITNVARVPLEYGKSSEVSFAATFAYEDMILKVKSSHTE